MSERFIGPERGGHIALGRTAAHESSLSNDEDQAWAELHSELDVLPWTFQIVIEDEEE
jgi:hypothetical protein